MLNAIGILRVSGLVQPYAQAGEKREFGKNRTLSQNLSD